MNQADAEKIAQQHLSKMNPDMWDGNGEKPKTFDSRIVTYQLSDGKELDISFEKDKSPDTEDEAWEHYCELRDAESGDCLTPLHGYGVNSMQNLADTINDVCNGFELLDS